MTGLRELFVGGVLLASVNATVGLALHLMQRVGGNFALSPALTYALAGYAALLASVSGLPAVVVILAGVVGGGLGSFLLEVCVYEPLRRRGASSLVAFVASIGVLLAGQNLLSLAFGDAPRVLKFDGPIFAADQDVLSVSWYRWRYAGASAIGAVVLVALLRALPLGREVRATADNPYLAYVHGIPVARVRGVAAVLGGALLGTTAATFGADTTVTPMMGMPVFFLAAIAPSLVRSSSLLSVAIIAVGVAFAYVLLSRLVPAQWSQALLFGMFAMSLVAWSFGDARRRR